MEVNLSYHTICSLRDCVNKTIELAEQGEKVLTLPTDNQEMEVEILVEYREMLDDFLLNNEEY